MSHYPSSAELAAFRRAVRMPPSTNHSPLSRHRGAWTNERTDGIGNRNRPAWLSTADHSLARREASALRSCASARIFGDGVTWPEVTTFAPEVPYRCINCRGIRCPEYACATYNPGEVAYIA